MAPDEAIKITRVRLALADQMESDPEVIALALIGAGIMLLSKTGPETAEALAEIPESGAFSS